MPMTIAELTATKIRDLLSDDCEIVDRAIEINNLISCYKQLEADHNGLNAQGKRKLLRIALAKEPDLCGLKIEVFKTFLADVLNDDDDNAEHLFIKEMAQIEDASPVTLSESVKSLHTDSEFLRIMADHSNCDAQILNDISQRTAGADELILTKDSASEETLSRIAERIENLLCLQGMLGLSERLSVPVFCAMLVNPILRANTVAQKSFLRDFMSTERSVMLQSEAVSAFLTNDAMLEIMIKSDFLCLKSLEQIINSTESLPLLRRIASTYKGKLVKVESSVALDRIVSRLYPEMLDDEFVKNPHITKPILVNILTKSENITIMGFLSLENIRDDLDRDVCEVFLNHRKVHHAESLNEDIRLIAKTTKNPMMLMALVVEYKDNSDLIHEIVINPEYLKIELELRDEILANENIHADTLLVLAEQDERHETLIGVCQHPSVTPKILDRVCHRALSFPLPLNMVLLEYIANHPLSDVQVLDNMFVSDEFAKKDCHQLHLTLLEHKARFVHEFDWDLIIQSTESPVLLHLIEEVVNIDDTALCNLIDNVHLSTETLLRIVTERLANKNGIINDSQLREIAGHEHANEDVFSEIVRDSEKVCCNARLKVIERTNNTKTIVAALHNLGKFSTRAIATLGGKGSDVVTVAVLEAILDNLIISKEQTHYDDIDFVISHPNGTPLLASIATREILGTCNIRHILEHAKDDATLQALLTREEIKLNAGYLSELAHNIHASEQTKYKVLACKCASQNLVSWIYENIASLSEAIKPSMLVAISQHINTSNAVLSSIVSSTDRIDIIQYSLTNPNANSCGDVFDAALEKNMVEIDKFLANHSKTPLHCLHAIVARRNSVEYFELLLNHENSDDEVRGVCRVALERHRMDYSSQAVKSALLVLKPLSLSASDQNTLATVIDNIGLRALTPQEREVIASASPAVIQILREEKRKKSRY